MGMNIKSEKAQRLAKQLAAETGLSMTAAIEQALEAEIQRLHSQRDVAERKRRVREIVDSFGPIPEGVTSDHSDLYDERGLPK
ncbi:type II toxin-antitoxin system VapB family antitoxin [Oryzicola mucosus]|uniref:Type II toxin-antitoxin system VapB family antitoxin n=1 Tax=Oryzicola mucosus TaxID=2767425 RepID=A0A8J6TWD7_9HYPH|nr:type II toxin-antitoxin system VapB family antitoxin [Oryzicola mucosus]MBD0413381.1 type II toxin-antitoxin system VapB family antitoxin [Oryzicola mucosus]